MNCTNLHTAAEILEAFQCRKNVDEEIELFNCLAQRSQPPIAAFIEILQNIKRETVLALTIQAFGKITDTNLKENLRQSDDLLRMLSEQAKSGETSLIRWSSAITIKKLGFDFINVSRYLSEEPNNIAQRVFEQNKSDCRKVYTEFNNIKKQFVKTYREQLINTSLVAAKNVNELVELQEKSISSLNEEPPLLRLHDDNEYVERLSQWIATFTISIKQFNDRLLDEVDITESFLKSLDPIKNGLEKRVDTKDLKLRYLLPLTFHVVGGAILYGYIGSSQFSFIFSFILACFFFFILFGVNLGNIYQITSAKKDLVELESKKLASKHYLLCVKEYIQKTDVMMKSLNTLNRNLSYYM